MAHFLHPEDAGRELALEDVFLVPGYWDGDSRRDVSLVPPDFAGGSHGIVSANMNAGTGKRVAEVLARFGGIGVLPQDMADGTLQRVIGYIKRAHARFDTAITVGPDDDVRTILTIINKRAARRAIVVEGGKPIGIVAPSDMVDVDPFVKANRLMKDPVTMSHSLDTVDMFTVLHTQRVDSAPVINSDGLLVGIISQHDLAMRAVVSPSLDKSGCLMVAATVGINGDPAKRALEAIGYGADVIVIDTAHGDQRKMIQAIRAVRAAIPSTIPIVAGNVCTAEATERLIDAGADIIKVNVGPGAMCTTRMQTGVGRPTFTAVQVCAEAARQFGKHVWADGGIKNPRDMALYHAAGASRVMIGTAFAGTVEAPGEIKYDGDRAFKVNWGMASRRAVADRNAGVTPLEAAVRGLFEEGISRSKIYLKPGRDTVGLLVAEFVAGVMSSMTYTGAKTLAEFAENAVVGVQTQSGYQEGTPHGAVRNG
jgi:IMP dehydrogenase